MTVASATIRVLLADDHPLVRAGLRASLVADDVELVGEAADAHEALLLCRALRPDVLLLDLNMPGPSPFEVVADLRQDCPQVGVLVVTAFDDDAYVRGLVGAGVAGYVLKDEAPDMILHAIRSVMEGGSWFSRPVMAKLVHETPTERSRGEMPHLTGRERELLGLLTQGLDNPRIAATLHLGEQTVRNYLSQLYDKLDVRSRAEAIVWALRRGLPDA